MKKFLCLLSLFFCFSRLFSQSLTINTYSVICRGFTTPVSVTSTAVINSCTWSASSNLVQFANANSVSTSYSVSPGFLSLFTLSCTVTSGANTLQAQQIVMFSPNLAIFVSANQLTTCIENNFPKFSKPVVLSASGATSYQWFPYNFQPNTGSTFTDRPSASTCYTVVGSTSFCSGSATICVSVIPQFTMGVVPNNPTICAGYQVGLNIQNISSLAAGPASAFTYSWTDPQSSSMNPASGLTSGVTVFPSSNATYTVEMRDANGCVSLPQYSQVSLKTCLDVGLDEHSGRQNLISPNPVKDMLTIKNIGNNTEFIELINLTGNLIYKIDKRDLNHETQIDLEQLEKGLYILKIKATNGKVVTIKVIKD